MQPELLDRLRSLARTPHLLVASDYDGTLAGIVLTPAFAFPNTVAIRALRAIREVAFTTTAIVSGRSFQDLSGFLGAERPHFLVGSHGAEWQQTGVELSAPQRDCLAQIAAIVTSIATQGNGLSSEVKPAGVALHFRNATRPVAEDATTAGIERCGRLTGVKVRRGSEVIEFMVVDVNKGDAVQRIKQEVGAPSVLFIGDDLTDEDVFRTLSDDDLAVRVGPGETDADFRIADVAEVAALLSELSSLRRDWAQREPPLAESDHE